MVKKKQKEITRKPDIVITTIEAAMRYMRKNVKICIIGLVILLMAIATGYAYALHAKSQYDKTQFLLAQGIETFDEYSTNGKKEDIDKAETIFKEVVQKKKGQLYYIAKLYLAKIDYVRGKSDDSKKLYQEVLNGTSSSTLKTLAEKAIQHIDIR